jgi:arylsulfatase A-like enzyme
VKSPNIVFVLADDLGISDLSCQGSTFYETPNLDKLAREGMRFTNAYAACPVCSPTRAAALTGKWPQRTGVTDYINESVGKLGGMKPGFPLLCPPAADRLSLSETTIARKLQGAGYATGFVGKWHLGGAGTLPENHGFDLSVGGDERGGNAHVGPTKLPGLDVTPGEWVMDRLTDRAIEFVTEQKDRPFFLWFAPYDPHTPLVGKPELVKKYEAKAARLKTEFRDEPPRKDRRTQTHAVYAAMLEDMDSNLGRLFAKLPENTVVIFTSDNGGLSTSEGSPTSNAPYRAGKGWLYEGGIREPLIVKWPGVVRPGTVNDALTTTLDFFPTFLEAARLRPEERDGASLVPTLKGKKRRPRPLFWHYPHYGNQGGGMAAAIRDGDWKLIEWFVIDRIELYNLKTDPGEQRNLAAQEPGRVKALQAKLHAWQKETDATFPVKNPNPKSEAR